MYELGLGVAVMVIASAILLGAVALSTHFVFRPLLLELLGRRPDRRGSDETGARLAAVEAELIAVGEEVRRLREATTFDRELSAGREEG